MEQTGIAKPESISDNWETISNDDDLSIISLSGSEDEIPLPLNRKAPSYARAATPVAVTTPVQAPLKPQAQPAASPIAASLYPPPPTTNPTLKDGGGSRDEAVEHKYIESRPKSAAAAPTADADDQEDAGANEAETPTDPNDQTHDASHYHATALEVGRAVAATRRMAGDLAPANSELAADVRRVCDMLERQVTTEIVPMLAGYAQLAARSGARAPLDPSLRPWLADLLARNRRLQAQVRRLAWSAGRDAALPPWEAAATATELRRACRSLVKDGRNMDSVLPILLSDYHEFLDRATKMATAPTSSATRSTMYDELVAAQIDQDSRDRGYRGL